MELDAPVYDPSSATGSSEGTFGYRQFVACKTYRVWHSRLPSQRDAEREGAVGCSEREVPSSEVWLAHQSSGC